MSVLLLYNTNQDFKRIFYYIILFMFQFSTTSKSDHFLIFPTTIHLCMEKVFVDLLRRAQSG